MGFTLHRGFESRPLRFAKSATRFTRANRFESESLSSTAKRLVLLNSATLGLLFRSPSKGGACPIPSTMCGGCRFQTQGRSGSGPNAAGGETTGSPHERERDTVLRAPLGAEGWLSRRRRGARGCPGYRFLILNFFTVGLPFLPSTEGVPTRRYLPGLSVLPPILPRNRNLFLPLFPISVKLPFSV